MRKRIGALGLAAVLLLAMICPALAAGTTFVVKGPDQAPRKGETFTVTVELENNPGFGALQFALTYDSEKMTCTDEISGDVLNSAVTEAVTDSPGIAVVVSFSAETIKGDGPVSVFTFTANDDLTEQDIGLIGLEIDVFCDEEGNEYPYDVEISGIRQTVTPVPLDPTSVSPDSNPTSEPDSEPTTTPDSEPAPEPNPTHIPESVPAQEPVMVTSFTDAKGHWAESFISRAAELGLFKGYADGSFGPNINVTRAQYVTVLYRMAGSPSVTSDAPFTDIATQSQEFRTAIAWGYEKGYINGKGEGIFDPSGAVTRQEAMKILFGYDGGASGMESMFTATYDQHFTDSDQLAAWGKPAMYWGIFKEIITGTSETTLSPQGTATRAQLAKILTVYYDQQNEA